MPKAISIDLAFGDIHADALMLPFADSTFAAIVTSHLIEHVGPKALLLEIKRVLRPGGRLYLEGPSLMGISRALRVWDAGVRDARYPTGSKTRIGAILKGIAAYCYAGRIIPRQPHLSVLYPGKDPDAVWHCNRLAVIRLLRRLGFTTTRSAGLFSHTFRIEAVYAR